MTHDDVLKKWRQTFKGRSKPIFAVVEITEKGPKVAAFFDSLQVAEELCRELNTIEDKYTVHSEELWLTNT